MDEFLLEDVAAGGGGRRWRHPSAPLDDEKAAYVHRRPPGWTAPPIVYDAARGNEARPVSTPVRTRRSSAAVFPHRLYERLAAPLDAEPW